MAYYSETEILNNGSEGSTITYNQSERSNSDASSALSVANTNNNLFNYIPARNRNYAKQLQGLRNRNLEMLNEEKKNLNTFLNRARRRKAAIKLLEDPVRVAQLKEEYAAKAAATSAPQVNEIKQLRAEERRKRKAAAAEPTKSGFLSKVKGLFTRQGGRRKKSMRKTRRHK